MKRNLSVIFLIAFFWLLFPVTKVAGQDATSAPRISVEGTGDDARLVISTDARDGGLLFKFGSVVGIYSGPDGANIKLPQEDEIIAGYENKDVAFNPTKKEKFEAWESIPYANGPYMIDENYHNLVNVKAGRGDPCRLAGYTAREIREATEVPDNGEWRLPTSEENALFTGYSGMQNWKGVAPFFLLNEESPFAGVAGAEFPKREEGGTDKFLPSVGMRNQVDGGLRIWWGMGNYWSADSSSNGETANCLLFLCNLNLGSSISLLNTSQNSALPIRCVRQ